MIFARRLVAQRCLYGVDRNPVAVDLAKLSLWLVTLAKDHALTFVDHALRHGDSLVGLSRRQIEAFHWDPTRRASRRASRRCGSREHVAKRRRAAPADPRGRRERLRLGAARPVGRGAVRARARCGSSATSCVAAFFDGREAEGAGGEAERVRERGRERRGRALPRLARGAAARRASRSRRSIGRSSSRRCSSERTRVRRDRRQPAVSGRRHDLDDATAQPTSTGCSMLHAGAHGNARPRCALLPAGLRPASRRTGFRLIATNTIAPGRHARDRARWICQHGGEIFAARRRVKWPGIAAVVVSVVHVSKGRVHGPRRARRPRGRDDHRVPLPPRRPRRPGPLAANAGKSFIGSIRPRHGLHLRRHRHEGRRHADSRRCAG